MAKVKEFQKHIIDDADFKDTIAGDHVFVEAHPSWAGPCECVKPMLYKISLEKDEIKFATAPHDKITLLKDHKDKVKPVFLYYKKGNLKKTIEGVNGPEILKLCESV